MDQLKPAIDWCKKNIFWIGCFLLSAAMIGTWVMASSSLAEQQTKRESDINKRLGDLNRVSGVRAEAELPEIAHPNVSTQQGMDCRNRQDHQLHRQRMAKELRRAKKRS